MDDTEKTVEKQPEPAPVADSPRAPAIHAAIAAIMAEVGGVEKSRKNAAQGYNFRGIADVYLACQLVMAKHGVHVLPHEVLSDEVCERETKTGGRTFHIRQKIRFRAYASDGSYVVLETTGEAMDTGDKATNKCMSAAMKYCLIQLFALPEQDPNVDTETQTHEVVSTPKPAEKPQPTTAQVEALSTLLQRLAPWKPEATEVERPAAMRAWCDRALGQKEGTLHSVRELTPEQADECIKIAKVTLDARAKELIK